MGTAQEKQPLAFQKDLKSYKGYCVAAVSQSSAPPSSKTEIMKLIPEVVSYDLYIGFFAIMNSSNPASSKVEQVKALFGGTQSERVAGVRARR